MTGRSELVPEVEAMRGIRGCVWACVLLGGIGMSAGPGCSRPAGEGNSTTASAPRKSADADQNASGPAPRKRVPVQPVEKRQAVTRANARDVKSQDPARSLSTAAAIERVLAVMRDSVAFAPTTVVWFLDISPSAMNWGSELHADVRRFYAETAPGLNAKQSDRLMTGIVTVGQAVEFPVKLTSDPQVVVAALDAIRMDSSGREVTFDALEQGLAAYLSERTRNGREVLFVVITDEAGDDWDRVENLLEPTRKYALPVYVVGVPAPFGRRAALDFSVEAEGAASMKGTQAGGGNWQPILQGPESRDLETIPLEFEELGTDVELLDAGFGPFGLEWLCRVSGGAFLAVREADSRGGLARARRLVWPTVDATAFEDDRWRAYMPDWVTATDYAKVLQGNMACQALHDASLLPKAAVLRDAEFRFEKRDEAELKNRLDRAQQAAAKVAPAVNDLYEMLRKGAGDAEKLKSPRWRAGYDLAMGRASAAKARIDGYNAMLAALKRGRSFTKPDSRYWVLVRASTTDESSALRNLVDRARTHLQRVVDEHPGTPWARQAQHELEIPLGWQWNEEP
jgi:hypothetical protein